MIRFSPGAITHLTQVMCTRAECSRLDCCMLFKPNTDAAYETRICPPAARLVLHQMVPETGLTGTEMPGG